MFFHKTDKTDKFQTRACATVPAVLECQRRRRFLCFRFAESHGALCCTDRMKWLIVCFFFLEKENIITEKGKLIKGGL